MDGEVMGRTGSGKGTLETVEEKMKEMVGGKWEKGDWVLDLLS